MTEKIPRRATALGRRAYGGDAADGPAVRGARARTAARTRGLGQRVRQGAGGSGSVRLGWRSASGGAGADAGARPATPRRLGALPGFVLLELCLNQFFSKILYKG
jgi:hypothetical protein